MSDVTKREAHIKYLCHVVNEVQWPQSTCVIALRAEHTTLFHGTPGNSKPHIENYYFDIM